MKTYKPTIAFILLYIALGYRAAPAQDYAWIIGGGPYLEHSQSQIELNVKWASQVILSRANKPNIKIFYTDGNNPAPDIINFITTKENHSSFFPFDYVFGGAEINAKEYYNHSIANVTGTTNVNKLKPALEKDFKSLTSQDKALILYNGHGGYNGSDLSNNHLRLWNKTKLSVYGFEQLLSKINNQTPVRFIMTQCFSGAFGNAIHPNASKNSLELEGNRCGFMAESARRESEGCTASLKVGDYRDYTTYFFAALDGRTRLNQSLANSPDRNGDNIVSLYEAHLYTLVNAYSTDLSRSTSEQYLEKWEPWYLRWLRKPKQAKNSVYFEIAHSITKRNGFSAKLISNAKFLRKQRAVLSKTFNNLKQHDNDLKKRIKEKQKSIIKSLNATYPKIKTGYKNKFRNYTKKIQTDIKTNIEQHTDFDKLPSLFKRRAELIPPLLEAERKLTQIEKVSRMLKLAKLDSYFKTFSAHKTHENYSALLSCENTSL